MKKQLTTIACIMITAFSITGFANDQKAPVAETIVSVKSPVWEYSGENGSQNWATLSEKFGQCDASQTSAQQSPVLITTKNAVTDTTLGKLQLNYNASTFEVFDNWRQMQINPSTHLQRRNLYTAIHSLSCTHRICDQRKAGRYGHPLYS